MTNTMILRNAATALLTSGLAMTLACGPSGGDGNNDNNSNNTTGSNNSNNTAGSNNTIGSNNSNNSNNTTGSNNSNNTTGSNNSNNSNNTTGSNNSNNSNNTTGSNNSNNSNNTTGSNNSNNTTGGGLEAAAMAIGDFRAEMTGTVTGAFVTYVRPEFGSEGAGFFIQATPEGPAIFVDVDPSTLSPVPAPGDEIELTVDAAAISNEVPAVTAISGFSVLSSGNDLSGLVQDVAAVDIVTAIGDYDSEMITLTGTIDGEFDFAGSGFLSAKLTTAGVPDSEDMLLRLPEGLATTLSLTPGCEIALPGTPLWRFRADAQPSAWVAGDITVTSCEQPTVTGAIATSDTEVVLTFDRPVDPASITNATTQFTADNGLTVSAAAVAGNEVTLTTSTQAGGTAYTVTVAATVLDDLGNAVDSNGNTAAFTGFIPFATVLINEFNAQITNGCDLIELRVTEGGSLEGVAVRYQTGDAYVFPAMTVAKNDFIIVHLDGADEKCSNDNPRPADETLAVDEVPASAANRNFDNAYDVYATPSGLSGATGVISIADVSGTILDAVVYADLGTGNASGGTVAAANQLIAASQWFDAAGAMLTPYPSGTPDARADAVTDVDTSSSDYADGGSSVGRADDTDTNNSVGWTDGSAQSWGAKNPGQADL